MLDVSEMIKADQTRFVGGDHKRRLPGFVGELLQLKKAKRSAVHLVPSPIYLLGIVGRRYTGTYPWPAPPARRWRPGARVAAHQPKAQRSASVARTTASELGARATGGRHFVGRFMQLSAIRGTASSATPDLSTSARGRAESKKGQSSSAPPRTSRPSIAGAHRRGNPIVSATSPTLHGTRAEAVIDLMPARIPRAG